jgi:hypothetical protein
MFKMALDKLVIGEYYSGVWNNDVYYIIKYLGDTANCDNIEENKKFYRNGSFQNTLRFYTHFSKASLLEVLWFNACDRAGGFVKLADLKLDCSKDLENTIIDLVKSKDPDNYIMANQMYENKDKLELVNG